MIGKRFVFSPLAGPNREKGQVLALGVVMMVGLVGVAALAVDVGYFFVARNQLQNVADGSALAATRTLGNIYQGIPNHLQQGFTCDEACTETIRTAAQDVANNNWAAGKSMTLRAEDVAIGQWDGETFTETLSFPDAVQVIARRDEVANGPVSTFFARILEIDTGNVNALATAALSGQGTSAVGEVEIPIGISRWFFDQYPEGSACQQDIQFHPSNDPASCAGWTSWNYGSNDATMRKIAGGNPNFPSPEIIVGETVFNFTGGNLSQQTFNAFLGLFQERGFDIDINGDYILVGGQRVPDATGFPGVVELWETDKEGNTTRAEYPDGTPRNLHKWESTLPVYDWGDCSNPNTSILIVGFAPIEITDVLDAPEKLVKGKVICTYVDEDSSRGGGGEYGIKGSVPGLVR